MVINLCTSGEFIQWVAGQTRFFTGLQELPLRLGENLGVSPHQCSTVFCRLSSATVGFQDPAYSLGVCSYQIFSSWCLLNPERTYSYLWISRSCNIKRMVLSSAPSSHVDFQPLFPQQLLALHGITASMPLIFFQGPEFLGLKCLRSGLHHNICQTHFFSRHFCVYL